MSINAVFFDLDDTLLWDDRSVLEAFESTCKRAAEVTGVDHVQLEAAVRGEARSLYESYETYPFTTKIGINPFEGLWANFTAGEQPEFRQLEQIVKGYRKDAWHRGLEKMGVNDSDLAFELSEHFASKRRALPYIYEETFQILKELQGNVKLLLLTNGCPALQQEKLDGVPELAPYFDKIVISGSFGIGKPDVSIFNHALSLLDVTNDQVLMVGDKLTTDIRGGLAAGIKTVWINRTNKPADPNIIPDFEIQHLSQLHDIIASFA
ncbi:HAD family hydrolase [Paenibacillus crassostreae]|uniref:Phosphoserine phosphatase n=1 Tax=Paenibacillus crassostreae TaxID=1763538 RepID=A0A167DS58_9BACL|nr:HAD family hydrolase [Paenibacillus crassostreae]AOZ91121.1 haloacid dehalogenase [Paenibacillus crassostreae]OAB74719.1 haloacid dehalogenase [Paenibacillus crassostreae]